MMPVSLALKQIISCYTVGYTILYICLNPSKKITGENTDLRFNQAIHLV